MSRTIGDRHSQKDSAELEGIRFDDAKWQHPYEATVHHPAEHIRRQMNGDVGLGSSKIYGEGVTDLSQRGMVESLMYYLSPGSSGAHFRSNTQPSLDEFRQVSPPVPIFNVHSLLWGTTGLASSIFNRWYMKQPMNARIHSTLFFSIGTFWAGYQYHKWKLMTELGEFKYAVDFAERHSDIINKQRPAKFGDPQVLDHWTMINPNPMH